MPLVDQVKNHKRGLWGGICDIWKLNSNIEGMALRGIRKVIGNGSSTWFWEDIWVGDRSLVEQFPRLYHISLQ